jgi:DNA-binding MarR family transcriptional regulator
MELLDGPPLKQGELAGALGLTKSAVSRMVVELERRGWIERHPDEDDGRVRRLRLTPSGKRLARQVDTASLRRFSTILEAMPPDARADSVRVLQALQTAIPAPKDRE